MTLVLLTCTSMFMIKTKNYVTNSIRYCLYYQLQIDDSLNKAIVQISHA